MDLRHNLQFVIVCGALSALMAFTGLWGDAVGLTLYSFCQVPLFMVALSLGLQSTLVGGLIGVVLLGAISVIAVHAQLSFSVAIAYMAGVGFPALVIGYFATLNRDNAKGDVEWYPVGSILAWLTAGAAALLTSLSLGGFGTEGSEVFSQLRNAVILSLSLQEGMELPPNFDQILASILPLVPGIAGAMWLLMVATNAIIAQFVLVKMRKNQRPMPRMAEIELPHFTPIVVAIFALLAAFGEGVWQNWGINMLIVLSVPLLMAGLAVIHALIEKSPNRFLWLVIIYAIVFILSPFLGLVPLLLIAALGLAEQWLNLRKRAAITRSS